MPSEVIVLLRVWGRELQQRVLTAFLGGALLPFIGSVATSKGFLSYEDDFG